MKRLSINSALILASILIALVVVELAARAMNGVEVFTARNWVISRSHLLTVHTVNQYDPVLGWRLKDEFRGNGFNSGAYGLRFTGSVPDPATAKILAVGDSFTAGSEVTDEFSWPAHLERLLGTQVLNGGVGAYGTDQIVLRAEQLLENVDPEILIVGFLQSDIFRSEFEVFGGGPKPYYTIADDELVEHNIPVPRDIPDGADLNSLAQLVGVSFMATQLLESVAPELFLSLHGPVYRKGRNDPVLVTCLLLQRLARKAKERDIRLIQVMQYGGGLISRDQKPGVESRVVMGCADAAGYQVVDEFSALRDIYEEDSENLTRYYVMGDGGREYGHMSSQGNRLIAGLIEIAINNPGVNVGPEGFDSEISLIRESVEGDGVNLVESSESLEKGGAALANVELELARKKGRYGKVYELEAAGDPTEHYLHTGQLSSKKGPHVASVYIKPGDERYVRFQLLDSDTVGLIANFDLAEEKIHLERRTEGRTNAWIQKEKGGWYRIGITADLGTSNVYSIIQFMKSDRTAFPADGEKFQISGFRVERGDKPAQ